MIVYNIQCNYIDFLQDHYELIAFIKYVGHILKNTASKEVVPHYISYKSIMGQWIRNDDVLCHTVELSGSYKVFYRLMILAIPCHWILDTEGLPFWRKTVVICSIYTPKNPPNKGRCPITCSKKAEEEKELILPDDSNSSSENETDKSL